VFALGTAAQAFVVLTRDTVGQAMALAGRTPAEITAGAPERVTTLRIVGVVFLVANLLLLAAPRGRAWTFWLALAVTRRAGARRRRRDGAVGGPAGHLRRVGGS